VFSLAIAAAGLAACAGATRLPDVLPPGEPLPEGALSFELVFDAAVDLDLYVTGPLLETVYYGNTPSRIGGSLVRDVRCDSPPGPRIETITFPAAPSGHYRVGVDFPERCNAGSGPAAYLVRVRGGAARALTGEIERGSFAVRVLELDYVAP